MEKRRRLFCRLMVALICSVGYFSSSALAQQKLDQTTIERWRADLRYLAEQLPARHMNLFHTMTRGQFEHAMRVARECVPRDNEMTIKDILPKILTLPEVLYGLGLIENMENARFVVEKGGEQITLDLKPVPWGSDEKWADARDDALAPTPLWLKNPRNNYWFEYLADSKTIYVQYNTVLNKRDESAADFFKRVFAFVDANPGDGGDPQLQTAPAAGRRAAGDISETGDGGGHPALSRIQNRPDERLC